MSLQQQNEIYQNLSIQAEQTSTQTDQADQTPMFGIDIQNIVYKNIEINNCINGIMKAILLDNFSLKQSFHLANPIIQTYFLQDYYRQESFQRNIFSLDFQLMIKQDRLQQYYKKSNLIQSPLVPDSQIKSQQNSDKLKSLKVSICYSDTESIDQSQKKKNLKKYKQIESQYSPKNLKTYLQKQLPKINNSQQKCRSQSTHNSSQITQNSRILKKQPNIQSLQKNNFCLISAKHKELSKSVNQNQNYQLSQIISTYNQSAKFN